MCGFSGVLAPGGVGDSQLRQSAAALRHRGPDDSGTWMDPERGIGLAHARLSVVDLSHAGHQPMSSPSERYVIVFNGEIYNHFALRAELEQAGCAPPWRGHSDTETLLAGFDEWGIEATVKKTVGMFAFAVWDSRSGTLTLGRDRVGEKPLYYGRQGGTFVFGSEIKALRAYRVFNAEIDRDALAAFMRYGYVPAPQSIYRGIFKLIPGTLLTVQSPLCELPKPISYWSLLDVARRGLDSPFAGSDEDARRELDVRLRQAVELQRVADVPVGVFLSGGIDSSLIASIMQAQSRAPIRTFTIGFEEQQYDEAEHARKVARHLGTDHTELRVTPDDARGVIVDLPTLYDEPFADVSQIPTFLVSQLARRSVTVSLSGDAGDELFGGYNRYKWIPALLRVPRTIRRVLAASLARPSATAWDRAFEAVRPVLPRSLRLASPGDKAHKLLSLMALDSEAAMYRRLTSTWAAPERVVRAGYDRTDVVSMWGLLSGFGEPEHRMMALDAITYLPDDILCKVDRAAMGVSLETRVPFLDHRVVEFAWTLPVHMKRRNGQSKWILRQLLNDYVPRDLIERPKMGFAVPIDAWLRGPLRVWAEELLGEERLRSEGYLEPRLVREKWVEHISGKRNWQHQLWNVLMFQIWLVKWDASAAT